MFCLNLIKSSITSVSSIPSISESIFSISHPITTCSRTGSFKPKQFSNYKLYHSTKYPLQLFHITLHETEPSNYYSKAATDPWWRAAMGQKFDVFCPMAPGVFLSFPFQPQYHWNKWVYKIKQKPNGWVERFEAKLAAKGIWLTMWHRLHWDFQPRDKAIYHQNYFSFDSSICLRY